MALIGECVQPGCSMSKDEYITEMKNEAIRGLQAILPSHDYYNVHFQPLQKFLIYSNEIHFSLLEIFPFHIFLISISTEANLRTKI